MKKKEYLALKELDYNSLRVLAMDIRSDILSNVRKNGGHLSSNLGVVELTIGLLRNFDPIDDDILFDVGHQTYPYKILTNRSLENLRQLDGEPPFSSKEDSPYDKYNNGHAATSISTSMGMAKAKIDSKNKSYTISVIGDASITSGLSFEGLNNLSNSKDFGLIIVLNDNGMSISPSIGLMSKSFQKLRKSRFYFKTSSSLKKALAKNKISRKLLSFLLSIKNTLKNVFINKNLFETLKLKYIGPYNGHDFSELDLAFERAKQYAKTGHSCLVHIYTKKGYGFPPAMNDIDGDFHGVSTKFDETREISYPSFSEIKTNYYLDLLKEDKNIYVISPAMEQGSGLKDLFKKYPNNCIDVGISEEHAFTFASGLAIKNKKPIVDIYSTFLQRSYDQLFEDISRENISVTTIIEKVGLAGGDGASHHGIYDVGFIRTIPNSKIYMPFDYKSAIYIFKEKMFKEKIPLFIRLSRDTPHVLYEEYKNEDSYYIKKNNSDTLIIGIGPRAVPVLNEFTDYDRVLLVSLLPKETELSFISNKYKNIFFYDAYSTCSGTSSIIKEYLFKMKYKGNFYEYTFKDDFYTHGNVDELLKKYHLDENYIIDEIYSKLKK